MNGSASVYLWRSMWQLHPAYVRGASSIASLPVTCLADDVDDLSLGQAIRAALAASAKIRTEPSERIRAALLKELGARSWSVLEREARAVSVSSTDGSIKIVPLHAFADPIERECGWRGPQATRLPMTVAYADLGRAVREGAAASSPRSYEPMFDDEHYVEEIDPDDVAQVDERELARLRFWSRVDFVLYCLLAVAVVAVLVMLWRLRF